MKPFAVLLRTIVFITLPLTVYLALQRFQPREVALALLGLALLRSPGRSLKFLRRHGLYAVPAALALAALLWRSNDPVWVLAYPVMVNALMLAVFVVSLLHPPSLIERMARLRQPDLPAEGVAYCRRVTQVWCAFFVSNGTIAAWTALAASRETWLLYNGLVAYLLMGILFAGEWLYRRLRFGTEAVR